MIYVILALCYAIVAVAEWPCKHRERWRQHLRHRRYIVEAVIALTYLALFIANVPLLQRVTGVA